MFFYNFILGCWQIFSYYTLETIYFSISNDSIKGKVSMPRFNTRQLMNQESIKRVSSPTFFMITTQINPV